MEGAAGAGGDPIGVEDVFKTYLYKGNDSARSINTNVDMTGGGLTWIKARGVTDNHILVDTERGVNKPIFTSASNAESTLANSITAFNNNGFSLGSASDVNWNDKEYVSFNFKKQEKFFDIVTYTGTGSAQNISHSLGSVPGMIMVKNLGAAQSWAVYHQKLNGGTNPAQYYVMLNQTAEEQAATSRWNDTAPTSSVFTVGDATNTNSDNTNYVAYLFAHEEAEFGPNSDQKIISCGSYTGGGSSDVDVNVGFEPSFLLVKKTSDSGGWVLFDSMRGLVSDSNDAELIASATDTESSGEKFNLTPTGFKTTTNSSYTNSSGHTYIYLAIAAETGKTSKVPENGTDVFGMDHGNGSSTNFPNFDSTFPVDLALNKVNQTTGTGGWYLSTRISEGFVRTDVDQQASSGSWAQFDSNVGWCLSDSYGASSSFSHMWKRYAGLDCLHYQGTGSARTISHNLGADNVPEMIWIKRRDFWQGSNWVVGHKGLNGGTNPWNYYLVLNEPNAEGAQSAYFNDTAPTSSVFTVGEAGGVNASGSPLTAILFSSVEGISHVGSYTGNGSTGQTITIPNGGFQPRFALIKNISRSSTSWTVLDTTRGWGSGDDKSLELNANNAQETYDYGAPTSTGFTLTDGGNWTNRENDKYIYYCHA